MNWLGNKVIASGQLGFDHNEIIDSEHKRREYNNRAYTERDRKKRELNEQLDGSKQKIQKKSELLGGGIWATTNHSRHSQNHYRVVVVLLNAGSVTS
jgi:uncharacterized protein YhaN